MQTVYKTLPFILACYYKLSTGVKTNTPTVLNIHQSCFLTYLYKKYIDFLWIL